MASILLAGVRALWFLCTARESGLNPTGNSVALFQTGMARTQTGGPASKTGTSPSSREWAGNVELSFPLSPPKDALGKGLLQDFALRSTNVAEVTC